MAIVRMTNVKHELFCQHYAGNGFVGAKAARDAGYSDTRADQRAYELLQRLDVQIRIEHLKLDMVRAAEVTREMVIAAYGAIAMTDRRRLRTVHIDDLSDEEAMCIDGFKYKDGELVEIKTVSRAPALKALAEYHNIFEDHQKSGSGEIHITIDGKDAAL